MSILDEFISKTKDIASLQQPSKRDYQSVRRWLNNLKRDHITPQLKNKGTKWNGWDAFRRGLATNLHDMGVPTKVIQRICCDADEATTKEHHIQATEPGVQRWMRKLEASITREKYERKTKRPA